MNYAKKKPQFVKVQTLQKKKTIAIEITTKLAIETIVSRSCAMEKKPNL